MGTRTAKAAVRVKSTKDEGENGTATTKAQKSVTLHFDFQRPTQNKLRFDEQEAKDGSVGIGALYITKDLAALLGVDEGDSVEVTLRKSVKTRKA
jgi:hypothetical protein